MMYFQHKKAHETKYWHKQGGVIGGPGGPGGPVPPNNLENYGGKKPVDQLIT